MAPRVNARLEAFFRERAGDHLRSIVRYERRAFDIVYLREDVAAQYDEAEIEAAVDESFMDSIAAPVYGNVFSEDHGELICLVQCYENVVEMNFVLADGVGTAVALDEAALRTDSGLVADAREIVVEARG